MVPNACIAFKEMFLREFQLAQLVKFIVVK